MNEQKSRQAMDRDDLWAIWVYLDRAEDQIPELPAETHVSRDRFIVRRKDEPVLVELPLELFQKLKSAIENIRNNDEPREVLGYTRSRGKKVHSNLEQDREVALAWAYDVALAEYGDTKTRLELATFVAESELSRIGRPKPFEPRYVQMLHQKYGWKTALGDRTTIHAFREIIESVLIRLRERFEE